MKDGGEIMEKLHFGLEEVVSFLEMKMIDNTATQDEQELYEFYVWNGRLKNNYTRKKLVAQMKRIYDGVL